MSGICGWVGRADPTVLEAMLAAIEYRGDRTDSEIGERAALGYRWWDGRPGKSPGLHRDGQSLVACAGTLAPPVPSPAARLLHRLGASPHADDTLATLDGAFAAAWWDGDLERLTLIRDPFGVRSLYYVEQGGTLYFATELKQLLAVDAIPVAIDPAAIHKYLTFSFVPGESTPIAGIERLLPGHVLTWSDGRAAVAPYFSVPYAKKLTLAMGAPSPWNPRT